MLESRRERILAAIFISSILIMLFVRLMPSLFGISAFAGYDMLDLFAPWSALSTAGDAYSQNPYITDQLDSIFPAVAEISTRLQNGDWAMRSNLAVGGFSLLSTTNLGLVSPSRWALVVFPLGAAPAAAKLFEIAFGSSFTFLFARRIGLSSLGATVAAGIFPLTGFMIAWTTWAQSSVASIVPMLFWAVERYLQRRTWYDLIPLSVGVGLIMLGGFPAVAAHSLIFLGIYAIVRCLALQRQILNAPLFISFVRRLLSVTADLFKLCVGVFVGLGLSAFQLLPFFETTLESTSLDYRDSWGALQDPLSTWYTLVYPHLGSTSASYQDTAAYVGATVLILSAIGLAAALLKRQIPRHLAVFFVCVICFVVAMISLQSVTLLDSTVAQLPIFNNNPPGRLRAQLALPFAVFAGVGVDWIRKNEPPASWQGVEWFKPGISGGTFLVTFGASLTFTIPIVVRTLRLGSTAYTSAENTDILVALLPTALIIILFGFSVFRPKLADTALGVALASIGIQAFAPTGLFWPTSEENEVYPISTAMSFLANNVGHNQVATSGLVLRPNVPNYYGVRTVNGHGFVTDEWKTALLTADPNAFSLGGTYSIFNPDRTTIFDNKVLDSMGVTYAVADATEDYGAYGVPTPLPGVTEVESTITSWVTTSNVTWQTTVNEGAVNGIVIPVEATVPYTITVTLMKNDEVITTNTVKFKPAGTQVDAPVGLAVSPDETGPFTAIITLQAEDPVKVATSSDDETPIVYTNRPTSSDYPLVYANENTLIWERTTAASRIRFVGDASYVKDQSDMVTSVLDRTTASDSVTIQGSPTACDAKASAMADLNVTRDDGDSVTVEVNASETGFLILSQSVTKFYVATIDGQETMIYPADIASGAVCVPEGSHTIEIKYAASTQTVGNVMSASALSIVVIMSIGSLLKASKQKKKTNEHAS